MGWDEERMHAWLRRQGRPRGTVGEPGNDAAVLSGIAGRPVLCTDACIEGVHFASGDAPRRVGRKAAARVLSDLAATAARPRALLLSIAAPASASEAELRALVSGARAEARDFGADLVGGDLCASDGPRTLVVTGCGELDQRRAPPGRARARPGQAVVATGAFGGARLGRHLRIRARVEAGRFLVARGATALMDVSDGLAIDLLRLARASSVAIDVDDVPIHPDARRAARASGRSALDHALHDGEDHELLATVPRSRVAALVREGAERGHELFAIGRVRAGRGVWMVGAAGERALVSDEGAWIHGRA